MLGATHSMANPLTAHHDIAHGQAVGMLLPVVVRFNACEPQVAELYATLACSAGLCPGSATVEVAVAALVERLEELLDAAALPRSLSACGVPRSELGTLAEEAARQWTAQFNPRAVTVEDFVELFERAWRSDS
jgi:alcohol dehydrogenase